MISVIIPTLNAARFLPRALAPLVAGAADGLIKEVIVVDGGSHDETCAIAEAAGCDVVPCERGRGAQLAAGAARARGDWLFFLHADTVLEDAWLEAARRFMHAPNADQRAGAFTFRFDDEGLWPRWVEVCVAVRSRLLKLPYGDQGLLISRRLYDEIGGYRPLALMEDVDIVRRIGGRRLAILAPRATTSAEKYRRDGYGRRTTRNLVLLARFYFGADPAALAQRYD